MPPRPRAARTPATAADYKFPEAERLNNPTAEGALMMGPDALADQPIPDDAQDTDRVRHPRLQWNRAPQTDYSKTYGPLYIHDKISPTEFLNSLLRHQGQGDMFATFNGLPDDANYKPYEYSGHWTNRLIRATAQRAMASLLYKDAMRGKVNLIYMDPPYNISFRSNFQANAQNPESAEDWDSVPDDPMAIKAFRDAYRDGVHSYLDGLHEQFALGRELLAEDGSFILQVGPDNVHEAVLLMAEVFGRENHVATIPYRTGTNQSTSMIPEIGNWLVWFAKDKNEAKKKYDQLYERISRTEIASPPSYDVMYEAQDGASRNLSAEERINPDLIPGEGRLFQRGRLISAHTSPTGRSDTFYYHPGNKPCPEYSTAWNSHACNSGCDDPNNNCPLGRKCGKSCKAIDYPCPAGSQWRVSLRGLHVIGQQNRFTATSAESLRWKRYEDEIPGRYINAVWTDIQGAREKQYVVETPPKVLERCLLMTTDPGDLVLDLTCGSGAMPFQAETWGRRWIAVDVAQVSIAITRERLITNTYPYHILKDSPEGAKLDHELEQELLLPDQGTSFNPLPAYGYDPAKGFVTERQFRTSAGTLAYGRGDEEPIRHPDRTRTDRNHIRVASGFTVESDSPYRSIRPGEENGHSAGEDVATTLQTTGFTLNSNNGTEQDSVTQRLIGSLETSGINQPGAGRYKVENLVMSDVRDVTHTGVLIAPDGGRHNAFFYIGREDEVISNVQTRNAATAIRAVEPDCNHLVMIGFGRDGDAQTVARYLGSLTVLQVAANKDLQLPWLKEEASDNAFIIVSEPEVKLHRQDNGQVRLEVVGINAFNPARGIVEARSARTIMGIMVDTWYDTESFRARLINVKEVNRNQRTLRNLLAAFSRDIDREKWDQMLTNTTIPFDLPEEGVKIAVKVIDQTGMEHMTVIDEPRRIVENHT